MVEIKFEDGKAIAYDNSKKMGECDFVESGNVWNITHTVVDLLYQGQGIARLLVECVIENAKKCNKILIADCSYAKKVIEK